MRAAGLVFKLDRPKYLPVPLTNIRFSWVQEVFWDKENIVKQIHSVLWL